MQTLLVRKKQGKKCVFQRADVVARRHRVLKELEDFRAKGYTIYYQDETWCNAHHTRLVENKFNINFFPLNLSL